jgi:tRNA-specific 2-thiouridylase
MHSADVVERSSGHVVGTVPAVELITVGQRRGLGIGGGGSGGGRSGGGSGGGGGGSGGSDRRFAVSVDVAGRRVEVGSEDDLLETSVPLMQRTWVTSPLPVGTQVLAQASAHGRAWSAVVSADGLELLAPRRRVAPGQTVALYLGDEVVGSGIARKAA